MTRSRHRPRRGSPVLLLLALLFFVTGLSRVGMGVVGALAQDGSLPAHIAESDASDSVADATRDPGDLFAALQIRDAEIRAREQRLDERAAELRSAQEQLQEQLNRLAEAEAQLAATLHRTETAAEDDLRHLTIVFENMKPAQASELFSQMDVEFAAGFIGRLRPEFAGEVMSALDPVIAYGISAVLAGRNARAPRN